MVIALLLLGPCAAPLPQAVPKGSPGELDPVARLRALLLDVGLQDCSWNDCVFPRYGTACALLALLTPGLPSAALGPGRAARGALR